MRASILFLFIILLLTSNTVLFAQNDINFNNYLSDFVKIKFKEGTRVTVQEGQLIKSKAFTKSKQNKINSSVNRALEIVSGSTWIKSAYDISSDNLDRYKIQAETTLGKTLPNMNLYFTVKLPEGISVSEAIELFDRLDEVEKTYPMPKPVSTPAPPDYTDPANTSGSYQRYLDPAPDGIDALYAWQGFGGSGNGVKIADMEYNWNRFHADLGNNGQPVTLIGPEPYTLFRPDRAGDYNHGTAVLGVYGGVNNSYGVKGISYRAEKYVVAQLTGFLGIPVYDNAAAILRAVDVLGPGDILLLEAQIGGPNYDIFGNSQFGLVPVEWDKPTYDAIQTAVGNGIIVIEAAGNGRQNLDNDDYNTGNFGHHPFKPENDSGAIIVGAGLSAAWGDTARYRHNFSNYGSTVDVQGWGDRIVTTGYGNLYLLEGPNLFYTASFSGTSGASPIVTGAAAVVQSTFKLKNGRPATPNEIRNILRQTGTPQQGTDNIGPLPDLKAAIDFVWGDETLSPAAPLIDPPSGTYSMPLQAVINYAPGQNSSNTNIRYTLDGSEPVEDSFIFLPDNGDKIYLNYGVNLKAKAFQYNSTTGRSYAGETASVVYISNTPKVATPQISPTNGSFSAPLTMNITTTTPGASIRYRTDGRAISFFYPGTLYDGPITLTAGEYKITARGYKDGYYKSDIAESGDINVTPVQLPAPTIYPAGGSFNGPQVVYMGSTVLGAVIRYTLDGSEPTNNSEEFVEPFNLAQTTTVKAKAFLNNYTPSESAVANITIIPVPEAPVIVPNGGNYTSFVDVSLSSPTPGAVIRYTKNGSEPKSFSTKYTNPFRLAIGQHTVKARAFLPNTDPGEISEATFNVFDPSLTTVSDPVITPFSTQTFVKPVPLTMSTATEGATIRYTVGFDQLPADPTETGGGSITYTNPVTIGVPGQKIFIKVRAFKQGLTPSNIIQTGQFSIVEPVGKVVAPVIDPPGGVFNNSVRVQLSSETDFAQLIFTLDGSEPSSWLPILPPTQKYNTGINIFKSQTLKAGAFRTFFEDSDITVGEFILKCAAPVIGPETDQHTSSVMVNMNTETENAKIYYTLDGSEPTDSSTIYSEPFQLSIGTHTLKARAYKFNFQDSEIVTRVFVVNDVAVSPVITKQPENFQGMEGIDVTLTVEAEGTEELKYQWLRDGILLAGEVTPELFIPNVKPVDNGSYRVIVSNMAGADTSDVALVQVIPLSVDEFAEAIPKDFALGANYPNPFNPTTTITVAVPENSNVEISIYNILGSKVRTLVDEDLNAGYHKLTWDGLDDFGRNVATGVYLYRMQTKSFTESKKMILIK